jgi:osmotically-inducible protein OsmY
MNFLAMNKYSFVTAAAALTACAGLAIAQDTRDSVRISESNISSQVTDELATSDAVDGHKVDVRVDGRSVVLSGRVNSLMAKRWAEDLALAVVGVRSVENNLEVMRTDKADEMIRNDIRSALLGNPATDSYELDVSVSDGVVTLRGDVESWAEKDFAESVAARVSGVTDIRNRIDVAYDGQPADSELKTDIEQRLANRIRINADQLDVSVDDGDVEITGTVGSAAEKRLVYSHAWLNGVNSVDIASIEVDYEKTRDSAGGSGAEGAVDDSSVRLAVRNAFFHHPLVDEGDIDVTVEDNRVTLAGTVRTLRAKQTAAELAATTRGVHDVKNQISVRSGEDAMDKDVEATVREALFRNSYIDRFDIDVESVNGHVHLYGTVDTPYEQSEATKAAATVNGVVDVSNYLVVTDEWEEREDWKILEDIKEELFWSPFVDSDDVGVSVADGVATLVGTVDDMDQRQAAAENAREGGARMVENNLMVSHGPNTLRKSD